MPSELPNLLESCGPQLHALLLRLTLHRDLAQDLLQELFLKLHRSPAFKNAQDKKAYAFRAAIHLGLDSRHRHKLTETVPDNLIAPDASPFDAATRKEQTHRLLTAIAELSPQAREATVLHFIQQRDYEEAAAIMEKSPHQVRALCADALRQLRTIFQIPEKQEVTHDTKNPD